MNFRIFNKWLIGVAALGGLAGLLLGQAGRLFAPLDIFAHFTPQFAVMLLSGCLAGLFRPQSVILLGLGALVTLGVHPLIAWLGNGQPAEAQAAYSQTVARAKKAFPPLKIVSLNSWHSHPDPDRIISFIKSANADFVVLVEFGPDKIKLLKKLRSEYPYHAHCSNRWYCSVAVLSRYPILAHGSGGPRTEMPAHVWISVQLGGRDLTVIGTHLHRPIDGMTRHRLQLVGLAKLAKNIEWPTLIAGDFNSTRWSDSYRLFVTRSGFTPMSQYLPSWPAIFPQLAIDHAFANKGLTILNARTSSPMGSDHLALITRFKFK